MKIKQYGIAYGSPLYEQDRNPAYFLISVLLHQSGFMYEYKHGRKVCIYQLEIKNDRIYIVGPSRYGSHRPQRWKWLKDNFDGLTLEGLKKWI